MNKHARFRSQLDNLKSNQRKVYDAIPSDKVFDLGQVVTVMADRGMRDRVIVQACLEHLVDLGLVRKSLISGKHVYSAIKLRAKPSQLPPRPSLTVAEVVAIKKEIQMQSVELKAVKTDPIQMLADVSADLAALAKRLDDIAVAVVDAEEARNKEMAALAQFRSALAILGPTLGSNR